MYQTVAHIFSALLVVTGSVSIIAYWYQLITASLCPKGREILNCWYPISKPTLLELYLQSVLLTVLVIYLLGSFYASISQAWPIGGFILYEIIIDRYNTFLNRQAVIKEHQ